MKTKYNFRFLLAMLVGIFMSVSAYAQDVPVTGTVIDDMGDPVLGANVVVKGTGTGATTNMDGQFSFKAPKGSTLVVTFIGYKTQEVIFNGQPLNITLSEDSEMLEDVVVIGYGVARKNDLTGSVTALKPDEKNHGVVTNAQDMLQGKIAGVNVTPGSGAPGTGATIRIRGGSSLNASNDPLIVIDGMALDNQGVKGLSNGLSMVNPADIETFTVLKDASATAIYGSRGSNGVIIITTKKGRGTHPQISYNGNVSVSKVTKTVDVLNAKEYRQFITDYYGEGSDAYNLMGDANTDWQDEIYRTAVSHDHNVTVSGSYKNLPYRLSVGYTDQDGVLKTSDFKRTTASLNLNPTFFDKHLTVNFNSKFMYARTAYANTAAISEATRMDPTQPVKADGYDNFGGYFTWTDDGSTLNDAAYPLIPNRNTAHNPVALLNEKDDIAHSRSWQGNLELDYKIHGFEDLHLHMNFAGDYGNGNQHTTYATWGQSNFYYGNDGGTSEEKFNLTYSAYAQYIKDFNKANHFDFMAGYEWSHLKYWGSSLYKDLREPAAGEEYHSYSSNRWLQESYLVSFFGRAFYSLLDRYLLTVTVRDDGSSRFNDHWSLFPSAAFAWKIKDEFFLRDIDWVSEAKVRAGWGQTGQQDGIGNYNYFATYSVNSMNNDGRYPILGVNDEGLLYRPDAYNKNLKWETTETTNVGVDFGFLRDRITLSADWYYRKTTDLINTASVSAGSNFRNQVTSNIGSMENKGIEIATTVRPIQTRNLQWEISANFSYNKNEITKLTGESSVVKTGSISAGTGHTIQVQAAGHPKNSFYVYQQVYGEDGKPLEGVYVDRNGDGSITDADLYFYKSPDAPYTAGLSSRIIYRNWDFGFNLRASFDNYVYNDTEAGKMNIDKRYDSSFGYLQNATAAGINRGWKTYDHAVSDYWVENGSFLKCDNITLGYSFHDLFNTRLNGRVNVSATNVFTITNYNGIDPEVYGGIDNNMYPRPFTMQLGLQLNF